jgi:hypothetical protein
MSLMPCFVPGQAYDEGIIIGRLLAGYGEIELQMCACLIAIEGIYDIPIREIFTERGAEKRIRNGRKALWQDFAKANLTADLTEALAEMAEPRLHGVVNRRLLYGPSHQGRARSR